MAPDRSHRAVLRRDWLERARGRRFEKRQVVFFAIILPLALASFWLVRVLSAS